MRVIDQATGRDTHVFSVDGILQTAAVATAIADYTLTQTIVTVTGSSQQVLAANPTRKYLEWMVVGTDDVTVVPGAGPAVVGSGMVYPGAGANKQGGSELFSHEAPQNAFQCIGTVGSGSVLIVWEG